jgi:hypothetical protein
MIVYHSHDVLTCRARLTLPFTSPKFAKQSTHGLSPRHNSSSANSPADFSARLLTTQIYVYKQ